jgi:hypothetical protein
MSQFRLDSETGPAEFWDRSVRIQRQICLNSETVPPGFWDRYVWIPRRIRLYLRQIRLDLWQISPDSVTDPSELCNIRLGSERNSPGFWQICLDSDKVPSGFWQRSACFLAQNLPNCETGFCERPAWIPTINLLVFRDGSWPGVMHEPIWKGSINLWLTLT